jgi:hypothetical protein
MIELVMEQEKSKFSLVAPEMKALFIMPSLPSRCGRIDFKFVDCIYYRTPFHEECLKHHGHKGNPGHSGLVAPLVRGPSDPSVGESPGR